MKSSSKSRDGANKESYSNFINGGRTVESGIRYGSRTSSRRGSGGVSSVGSATSESSISQPQVDGSNIRSVEGVVDLGTNGGIVGTECSGHVEDNGRVATNRCNGCGIMGTVSLEVVGC